MASGLLCSVRLHLFLLIEVSLELRTESQVSVLRVLSRYIIGSGVGCGQLDGGRVPLSS